MPNKTIIAATLAITLAACSTPGAEAPTSTAIAIPAPAPLPAMAGVYGGSYVCTDGEHGFYLDIKSLEAMRGGGFDVSGVLGFFPTIGGKDGGTAQVAGSFEVSGTIFGNGKIHLEPGAWLKLPSGYGAAALDGMLIHRDDGLWSIKGKPVVPGNPDLCSDLVASKFLP